VELCLNKNTQKTRLAENLFCLLQVVTTFIPVNEGTRKQVKTHLTSQEKTMSLVTTTTPTINDEPLIAEVDMGSEFNALTVRATVVQASTIFYDTPATLGLLLLPL